MRELIGHGFVEAGLSPVKELAFYGSRKSGPRLLFELNPDEDHMNGYMIPKSQVESLKLGERF